MAAKLWTVAVMIGDSFAEGMGEMWLDDFPTVAKQFTDEAFIGAFAARFEVLAQQIGAGLQETTDITTCTADEVALHMVVDRAEELEDEGFFHGGWFDALEQQDADDCVSAKDMLFMDFDVLLLFDPSLDGVEDPASEAYQVERFENLHPRDWFKMFEEK
ncbi:MAG: hypothetical protein WKF86_04285 [Acidimicrobiales bacterium]